MFFSFYDSNEALVGIYLSVCVIIPTCRSDQTSFARGNNYVSRDVVDCYYNLMEHCGW